MQFVTTGVESLTRRIALSGLMSRGQAERAIKQGLVRIDGQTVTQGIKVADTCTVEVDGVSIPPPSVEPLLFGLIKPRGYLSEFSRMDKRRTLRDLMDVWSKRNRKNLGPRGVSELDPINSRWNHLVVINKIPSASTGLILLTNDGLFSETLNDERSRILTTFRLRLGNLTDTQIGDIRKWQTGVRVAGTDFGPVFTDVEKRTPTQTWLKVRLMHSEEKNLNDLFWYRAGVHVNRINCYAFGPYTVGEVPNEQLLPLSIHETIRHLLPKRQVKPLLRKVS